MVHRKSVLSVCLRNYILLPIKKHCGSAVAVKLFICLELFTIRIILYQINTQDVKKNVLQVYYVFTALVLNLYAYF